ncbi:unnamed protein product [Clonostachys rosea]|uniref:DUF676 domain-containing protein n=1 Tax=Bionectria ochroleuca TaxID=29856 RepID=A0ABY6TQD4_BIOOC|nr:unnamed protein product [Clonostachys rosea]
MSSIRFQGVSNVEQFFEIKSYLEGLKGNGFLQSSGVAPRAGGDFEATITFSDRADKDRAMGILRDYLPETFPEISTDDKFMGITILACPESYQEGNIVDIISVHGLEGHATNTWTCSSPNARVWLRDFLPRDIPNARVMSFGYESHVRSKSVAEIEDTARQLLNGLKSKRETENACSRPLIFIAHSLGGLVVKKASFLLSVLYHPKEKREADNTYIGYIDSTINQCLQFNSRPHMLCDILRNPT